MSEIQDASDFIKRQANQYKSFVAISDALDKIGPIANAAKEAAAARDAAVKAKEQAESELNTVLTKIEDAHSMAADVMIKGENEAIARAEAVATKAKQEVEAIVAKAQASANVIEAKSKADVENAASALAAVKVQLDARLLMLENTRTALDLAQKEHDKLAKAIEAMKAKFA